MMQDTREPLPVIFRKGRTKDTAHEVTAVFPTLPWSGGPFPDFTVYAHVGQHGGAHRGWYAGTRAAEPEEYADLLEELESIYGRKLCEGDTAYRLIVTQRMSRHHDETRKAAL